MNEFASLIGLFRRFRSLVLGREVEVVGHCTLCGNCCRAILLSDRNRWLRRKSQFDRLVAEEPEHARFRIRERSADGFLTFDCTMLAEDDTCTCHDIRPALCRNYPTKSIYYQGGWLYEGCGYAFRAVTFRDVLFGRKRLRPARFTDALERELKQNKD